MQIFLDSSDVAEISKAVDTGLIDGVTTNPSLMLKAGEDPREVLMQICEMFSWDSSVSAEVSGETCESSQLLRQSLLQKQVPHMSHHSLVDVMTIHSVV